MYVYIYVYIYVCVYVYMCVYIYIYIYIYIKFYAYVYEIYIDVERYLIIYILKLNQWKNTKEVIDWFAPLKSSPI